MRERNFADHLQDAARRARNEIGGIITPKGTRTTRNWPLCNTCLREVDACEIKDVSSKGCVIWARCHGAEDYYRVKWDIPMKDQSADPLEDENVGWAIKRAMTDAGFFVPGHEFDLAKRLGR